MTVDQSSTSKISSNKCWRLEGKITDFEHEIQTIAVAAMKWPGMGARTPAIEIGLCKPKGWSDVTRIKFNFPLLIAIYFRQTQLKERKGMVLITIWCFFRPTCRENFALLHFAKFCKFRICHFVLKI